MPFTVEQLIADRPKPVVVQSGETLARSVELMIEHDFSQLPVVDATGKLVGMITSDSAIRALEYMNTRVCDLKVAHARVEAHPHFRDDDVFDLLGDLQKTYAVPIVDGEGKAVGIVTNYDTTEFFRSRAQDVMYVEDIELALKEYINSAFVAPGGEIDVEARNAAISEITRSQSEQQTFTKALRSYVTQSGGSGAIQADLAERVFKRHVVGDVSPKGFDDLTLSQYCDLLLRKETWSFLQPVFELDQSTFRELLEAVRETRNKLFHFRGEISPLERSQLQFCADWLNRQRPQSTSDVDGKVATTVPDRQVTGGEVVTRPDEIGTTTTETESESIQPVEDLDSSDSRYAALARYLRSRADSVADVSFSFEAVEAIIGGPLPAYARQHRSWWANDAVSHAQSLQWLEAGWRVRTVNVSEERVVFTRNQEREQRYIRFFSEVKAGLEKVEGFPLRHPSPNGQSWLNVAVAPSRGPAHAVFAAVFAARSQFRVELYIDTLDKVSSKRLFDTLYARRVEIDAAFGEALDWQRLDSRRACRIALTREGSITDPQDRLNMVRDWAVTMMPRLYRALIGEVDNALLEQ